jgi:hypothetical protein
MYLSGMAHVLVSGLRRLGLKATELATAQAATIRGKLFKIGPRMLLAGREERLNRTLLTGQVPVHSGYPRSAVAVQREALDALTRTGA